MVVCVAWVQYVRNSAVCSLKLDISLSQEVHLPDALLDVRDGLPGLPYLLFPAPQVLLKSFYRSKSSKEELLCRGQNCYQLCKEDSMGPLSLHHFLWKRLVQ